MGINKASGATSQVLETLIDTESVALWYHPRIEIVHHELRRFVFGTQWREVLEKGLELFLKRGASKWLSDDRGNGPLNPADEQWALKDWAPRVIGAGLNIGVSSLPEKVLGQMNMKRWIDTYAQKGVTARAFTDPDEALKWLIQQ